MSNDGHRHAGVHGFGSTPLHPPDSNMSYLSVNSDEFVTAPDQPLPLGSHFPNGSYNLSFHESVYLPDFLPDSASSTFLGSWASTSADTHDPLLESQPAYPPVSLRESLANCQSFPSGPIQYDEDQHSQIFYQPYQPPSQDPSNSATIDPVHLVLAQAPATAAAQELPQKLHVVPGQLNSNCEPAAAAAVLAQRRAPAPRGSLSSNNLQVLDDGHRVGMTPSARRSASSATRSGNGGVPQLSRHPQAVANARQRSLVRAVRGRNEGLVPCRATESGSPAESQGDQDIDLGTPAPASASQKKKKEATRPDILAIAASYLLSACLGHGLLFPELPRHKTTFRSLAEDALRLASQEAGRERALTTTPANLTCLMQGFIKQRRLWLLRALAMIEESLLLSDVKDLEAALKIDFSTAIAWRAFLLTLSDLEMSELDSHLAKQYPGCILPARYLPLQVSAFTDDPSPENSQSRYWNSPTSKAVALLVLTGEEFGLGGRIEIFRPSNLGKGVNLLALANTVVYKATRLYTKYRDPECLAHILDFDSRKDQVELDDLHAALTKAIENDRARRCIVKMTTAIHGAALSQHLLDRTGKLDGIQGITKGYSPEPAPLGGDEAD